MAGVVAALVIGYLIGSVLFAVVFSRVFGGDDVRRSGSGNPGFTNVLRTHGRRAGYLTLLGDAGKGALAVFLARGIVAPVFSGEGVALGAVAGLGAIAGHAFPLYHGFRGGKGVATGAGAFLCLAPLAGLVAIVVWGIVLVTVRIMSVASIAGALTLPAYLTFFASARPGGTLLLIVAWIVSLAIVLRHLPNLARLARGEEPRFPLKRR